MLTRMLHTYHMKISPYCIIYILLAMYPTAIAYLSISDILALWIFR